MDMVRIKVAEATGPALDWLVASIEQQTDNRRTVTKRMGFGPPIARETEPGNGYWMPWAPSTDPAQGHPILEREGINLRAVRKEGHAMNGLWLAMPAFRAGTDTMVKWVRHRFGNPETPGWWEGPTALIAGLRCFVASRLGNEVEVPATLIAT